MAVRRPPIEPTPQKLLTNGCIEIRTPLITKISDPTIPNGNSHGPRVTPINSIPIAKPNGTIQSRFSIIGNLNPENTTFKLTNLISANGHARTGNHIQPDLASKPSVIIPVPNSHSATLLDTTTDTQATIRRQSVLLDELSPIESSASSVGSSTSQQKQRRRLPTIGANYPYKAVRSPFMQSQSSTLSLPINGDQSK